MKMSVIRLLVLVAVPLLPGPSAAASPQELLELYRSDFEAGDRVAPFGWRRAADESMAHWSRDYAASGERSLAVIDDSTSSHTEWVHDYVPLPEEGALGQLTLSWSERYRIRDGNMRLTVTFFDEGAANDLGSHHFETTGITDGFDRGNFRPREESIHVPRNARLLRLSLVSGGPAQTTGEYYIDDLVVSLEVDEAVLEALSSDRDRIVRPMHSWDMSAPHPRHSDRPDKWELSGPLPYMARWCDEVAATGTHSLRIDDHDDRSYGLWTSDRMPLEPPPLELEVSFRIRAVDLEGAWSVAIPYYDVPVQNNFSPLISRIDGMITPGADGGIRLNWRSVDENGTRPLFEQTYEAGDRDAEGFWEVSGIVPVPESARSYRFAFMSGWEPSNTGTAWLDDVRIQRVD